MPRQLHAVPCLLLTLLCATALPACGSSDPSDSAVGPTTGASGDGGDETGSGPGGHAGTGGAGPSGSTGAGLFTGSGGGDPGPWQPPIGIPAPDFGVNEVAPATPSPWTAPTPGFYYVDESAPGATDDGNDYGTPALPRASIPTQVPAGGVVEVHGTYDRAQTSPYTLVLSGTPSQPVFIRGVDADHKAKIGSGWEMTGSYYILENLDFGPNADATSTGSVVIREPTSRGVMRDSEVSGLPGGGGVGVVVWTDAGVVDHVLLLRNFIHDNGDLTADFDQDCHGIAVSQDVSYLWVLENEMTRNSGDGIQINAGSHDAEASLNHIYVGRNVSHENRQSGFWVKQATDVIFSQNVAYGHRPFSTTMDGEIASGDGLGFQYNPDYIWFLYNVVYDCDYGITGKSNDDESLHTHQYVIGNLVADVHSSVGYDPSSAWTPGAGVMLNGGYERYVINNTILDVDSGIDSPARDGTLVIRNNLVAQVTEAQGGHVFLEDAGVASRSTLDHGLFDGTTRIRWGDYAPLDLGAFKSAFPGQCAGCVNATPTFVDLANGDLHPAPGSPAIDAGAESDVYAAFQARYGIDIAKDLAGAPRPQGGGWDLGALEAAP